MEKIYELDKVTPKEMVEDFFEEEAKEQVQVLLDDGWTIAGLVTKDTTDEEIHEMIEKMADAME